MSNQAMQVFGGANVPAIFQSLMSQMQQSELSQNVGAKFAVVSFKGKVFRIKHDGQENVVTIEHQGQVWAAPYMDVVIPLANANLSKTYYATGYAEGSDEAPSCWSEDGRTPLAPLENRPIVPQTGQHCTDCALCPMNQFGSKINEASGAKSKACADTRKLIVVPLDANNNVDTDNVKYGGPMLLRVPAASLQVFAEYDRKLTAMGVPYFAVVTRMQFDQTVAYPKFVLQPVRMVTEEEASRILALRDSPQVLTILNGAHSAAPALAAPQVAVQAAAQPVAEAPAATAVPVPMQAAPAPVPMQAAPAPVPPVMAAMQEPAPAATSVPPTGDLLARVDSLLAT